MKRCSIEAKCPYSTNCKHQDLSDFCAHRRMNDPSFPLQKMVCKIHPTCFYGFVCNMSASHCQCKKFPTPPAPPNPIPKQFNPYATRHDETVFYLPEGTTQC